MGLQARCCVHQPCPLPAGLEGPHLGPVKPIVEGPLYDGPGPGEPTSMHEGRNTGEGAAHTSTVSRVAPTGCAAHHRRCVVCLRTSMQGTYTSRAWLRT